jgi:hypothetical protein
VTSTLPPNRPSVAMACLGALLVPGLGHALYGKPRKAVILLVVLTFMFICGLSFGGRVFPFGGSEPLVWLAAAAEWGLGAPRLLAAIAGWGAGDVVAATYEYGNTFLIVAGLLNALAVLDVFDIGMGRKS